AAAGQSSRGQLSREPTRHGGERGDIGPVGGGERHPVELLEQVAQLAQRRVGTGALDDRQALGRVERRVRLGYRARQGGAEPPDRPLGDGFRFPRREPPGVGDLTFQWNWRCGLEGSGPPSPHDDARGKEPGGPGRVELPRPDLPAGGDGDRTLEPDGVADGGCWGTSDPSRRLSCSTTPRRYDAKDDKYRRPRQDSYGVTSSGRTTCGHRFRRRARSANARRSTTPYGTLVWSATRSTPAWASFRVRSWSWRSAATLTRVRV